MLLGALALADPFNWFNRLLSVEDLLTFNITLLTGRVVDSFNQNKFKI